jgi:SRSO17 transposase
MSLLDHPEARALLADAEICPDDVQGCKDLLQSFLQRSLPLFARQEHREHAGAFVRGLLSGLERKSIEPIAAQADIPRKNLQYFVGAGAWQDEAVTAELRQHVAEQLGDREGILVLDPSGFPKKGMESCGVARQWCGRRGKKDNCQIGVFLTYVSAKRHAPLDARLYLPKHWAEDAPPRVGLAELVRVRSQRHRVERVLQEAKGEVGLAHYEVRSWVGWHHHVTLALLALWFLILERQRPWGEKPRP